MKSPHSSRLKVLYVSQTGTGGGAARSLRFLIENVPRDRFEPIVVSPEGPAADGFRAAGVKVLPIEGVPIVTSIEGVPLTGIRRLTLLRELWNTRCGPRLRAIIKSIQPDLMHVNERGAYQAAYIGHQCGLPVVMHARCIADRSNALVNYLDRVAQKYVTRFIAIDECVRRSLHGNSKCEVIYNPLPNRLTNLPVRQTVNRPLNVGFLCGLQAFKGIWDLLETAKLLRDRTDIRFRIYGGNGRPSEFYASKFGKLCSAIGLVADSERQMAAWLQREGLSNVELCGEVGPDANLFQEMDVLVFPSRLNGVGRSVYEAGVYGIPAIVCMEHRVEDIVVDGVTALITKPRDPSGLAQAIVKLAENHDLRRRLGQNAHHKYVTQFDPVRIAGQVADLYGRVLDEHWRGRVVSIPLTADTSSSTVKKAA